MAFKTVHLKHLSRRDAGEGWPEEYKSKSSVGLVDLQTLEPALDIIERHTSPIPLARYVTKDGKTYYSLPEIAEWAAAHDYEFVERGELDPLWIRYVRTCDLIQNKLSDLADVESRLGFSGDDAIAEAIRATVIRRAVPKETTPASTNAQLGSDTAEGGLLLQTEGETNPPDWGAKLSDPVAQHKIMLRTMKTQLTKTEGERNRLRQQVAADQDLIDKLMRERDISTSPNADKTRKRVRYAAKPFTCVPLPTIDAKPIKGFEDVIPIEGLLPQLVTSPASAIAGIYFLLNDNNEVVYIGQSSNVISRIGHHCVDAEKHHKFVRVAAVAVPKSRLLEIEAKYIAAYAPILNKTTEEKVFARTLARRLAKLPRRRASMARVNAARE